jgi:predicted alpha/beta-hydrolase family hydrolase
MSSRSTEQFDAGNGVSVSFSFSDPVDPADASDRRAVLVFGHGAGANMDHANMVALSEAFSDAGVVVLRFNFPFMEQGRRRVDSKPVSIATIAAAARLARLRYPRLPLLLGGHSFGGRMASHAFLEADLDDVTALVFGSFPLHPAGKPSTDRAAHLADIDRPMLFLSGTRDALATDGLLAGVVDELGERAHLHRLDTANHGYKVLKRSRQSEQSVFEEMGEALAAFLDEVTTGKP